MLEILVCIIGLPILMYLTPNDECLECKSKALRRKLDNMTTCEIDTYLKERDLYNIYKDNSKQYKIDKIIERSR